MAYEVDAQGYGNPPGWNDSQKIAPDSLQGLLDWFRQRVAWYHYQLGDSAMLTDKGSGRRLYVDEYIAHLLHLAKLRGECFPWLDFCPDGNLASTCQSLLAELEKARAERGIPTEKPGETEVDISSLLDEVKFNWTLMNEGGHKKQYLAEQALRNAHRWLLFHGHYDAPELPNLSLGPGVLWHPVDAENELARMLKYLAAKTDENLAAFLRGEQWDATAPPTPEFLREGAQVEDGHNSDSCASRPPAEIDAAREVCKKIGEIAPDNLQGLVDRFNERVWWHLRLRAKEALLRALGFQFNRHVRELSVALKDALAAEDEATVQAAWQALTQALPREGGPASLDELQERWAAAGRDVAGIDWATVHLRGMATGLLAAGNGQDGAQVGAVAGGAQKPTINTRMLELVQRDLARVGGWTAKQWAAELRCAPSAVVATPTWKDLAMARERQKAERQADRRRRKRPAKRG